MKLYCLSQETYSKVHGMHQKKICDNWNNLKNPAAVGPRFRRGQVRSIQKSIHAPDDHLSGYSFGVYSQPALLQIEQQSQEQAHGCNESHNRSSCFKGFRHHGWGRSWAM